VETGGGRSRKAKRGKEEKVETYCEEERIVGSRTRLLSVVDVKADVEDAGVRA
jgi:hypothetical protein